MNKLTDWKPADGLTLEPNAFVAASKTDGCLALTAGPGAGKTEMLAQRADFLLRTSMCRYPRRILAISFKVDASQNLNDRVFQRCGYSLASRFDSYTFHAFAKKIIDRFRPVLTGYDQLDRDYKIGDRRVSRKQITFSDLVPLATQIVRDSEIAKRAIQKTYKDVFLDEFQDCTGSQYELIHTIFFGTETRIVAVGDTKQRIMGWAGAIEGIFINYAEDFNAEVLNLYRNFRSKPQLIRLQNEVIKVLDISAAVSDEEIIGEGGTIEVLHFDSCLAEAKTISEKIRTWVIEDNVYPSEIAILVSKQPELYLEKLFVELTNRGITFRNEVNLQDISSEPVARIMIDYLTVIHEERNPNAYIRLMNTFVNFGLDEEKQPSLSIEWQRFIQEEFILMEALKRNSNNFMQGAWSSVERLLNKLGSERVMSLSRDYEQGSRLTDVISDTKTKLFDLYEEHGDFGQALNLFSDDKAVRVMTIHKSKGLEFDAVIILGVEKETFWGKDDEERCAFFVGVSRAKDRLVLTYADKRLKPDSCSNRWNENRTPHEEYLEYTEGLSI